MSAAHGLYPLAWQAPASGSRPVPGPLVGDGEGAIPSAAGRLLLLLSGAAWRRCDLAVGLALAFRASACWKPALLPARGEHGSGASEPRALPGTRPAAR